MNWFILILAGLLEVAWIIGLRYSYGFTKPIPSIVTVISIAGSFYLLSLALRTIPLSVAYTSWVGIGVIGTATFGFIFLEEPFSLLRLIGLLFIITGIVCLKLASGS
jgi:quaternary ammonium compound-resistance protein SugE